MVVKTKAFQIFFFRILFDISSEDLNTTNIHGSIIAFVETDKSSTLLEGLIHEWLTHLKQNEALFGFLLRDEMVLTKFSTLSVFY